LEGGRNANEGRLEVKHHGVWGSVCDDDFNLKAAQVACNSMGFYGPAVLQYLPFKFSYRNLFPVFPRKLRKTSMALATDPFG